MNQEVSTSEIVRKVCSGLEEKGFKVSVISIQHLTNLEEEINALYNQGVFDDVFYNESLTGFKFDTHNTFPEANSIIITAAPQPQKIATFFCKGKSYNIVIPPTYSLKTDDIIEKEILDLIVPSGFNLCSANVPVTPLAAHNGLAKYGRNNITYVRGMGSFHRLKAFLSDLPVSEDNWLKWQLVDQCQICRVCIKQCPTGAIIEERFLIKAEKCLTFHNERIEDFPDWIEPSWHNCLIGCMKCQVICPVNKDFINWFEDTGSFTEEETESILRSDSKDQIPMTAQKKLKRLYLFEDWELVKRNLGVLVDKF